MGNPLLRASRHHRSVLATLIMCLFVPSTIASAPEADGAYVYAVPAADASPAEVVAALESALLQSMQDSTDHDLAVRARRLAPVVNRVLDHRRMSALVLGLAWRDLDEYQRQEFSGQFERLSVATYARQFDRYSGQRFEMTDSPEPGPKRAVVRTRMIRPNNDPVSFVYQLIRSQSDWRVVGIQANGVSDLAIRRSQYARRYADGGLDAVLDDLRAEIAELERR